MSESKDDIINFTITNNNDKFWEGMSKQPDIFFYYALAELIDNSLFLV